MVRKLLAPLLAAGIALSPISNTNAEPYLFGNIGASLITEPNLLSLNYAPQDIRNIPVHKDDQFAKKGEGAIENRRLKYPYNSFNLETSLGVGIDFNDYEFRVGGNLRYPINLGPSDIERRNYLGAPGTKERGTGTALTYYGFKDDEKWRASDLIPGVFARLRHKKGPFLEYALDFQNIEVAAGYDRYDKLSPEKEYKLTRLMKNTIKLGVGTENSQLFVGYVVSKRKDSEVGRMSKIETPNHFIFGIQGRLGSRKDYTKKASYK